MNSMIIAVAGGTGSGKSYLAKNLANTYPKKEILIISNSNLDITKNVLEIVNKQIKKID